MEYRYLERSHRQPQFLHFLKTNVQPIHILVSASCSYIIINHQPQDVGYTCAIASRDTRLHVSICFIIFPKRTCSCRFWAHISCSAVCNLVPLDFRRLWFLSLVSKLRCLYLLSSVWHGWFMSCLVRSKSIFGTSHLVACVFSSRCFAMKGETVPGKDT